MTDQPNGPAPEEWTGPVNDQRATPRDNRLPHRERTRRWVLAGLFTLLAVIVVGWLTGVAFLPEEQAERLSDVADKVFAGLVGIFGAAVGFYFQSLAKE